MWLSLVPSLWLAVAPGDADFARGVEALKAKDSEKAIVALEACIKLEPKRVDCRWELGWAFWLEGEWPKVIEAWEAVKALDPRHPSLEEHLSQARAQMQLLEDVSNAADLAGVPDTPTTARPPPSPGAALRLRAVGDVMLGSDFPEGFLPEEDGASLLADVKGWLEDADITFANLEGPLCDGGETHKCGKGPEGSCYAFRTPTRYGQYLSQVGIDVASTANNHSGDFGEECRRQTESTLDALGIRWSGPPGSIAYLERRGVKLAVVAFHTSLGCNDLNDEKVAELLVRTAAKQADVVMVSFHGGAEGAKYQRVPHGMETFHGEKRGDLRRFVRRVIDAGADVVIGHGPHVLRGMEIYKGRLVAYSLGNFATYGRFNLLGVNGVGAVLEVTVDAEGRFLEGQVLGTRQMGEGIPVRDPRKEAISLLRKLSADDFPESHVLIDEQGRISGGEPRASQGQP